MQPILPKKQGELNRSGLKNHMTYSIHQSNHWFKRFKTGPKGQEGELDQQGHRLTLDLAPSL